METINDVVGNPYDSACPSRKLLDLIGGKWTVLIVGVLSSGPARFSQIRNQIDGISQKMLTQTLRELEGYGLVSRTVYAEVPPRVEYALTAVGNSLQTPLAGILTWAEENLGEVLDAQQAQADLQLAQK